MTTVINGDYLRLIFLQPKTKQSLTSKEKSKFLNNKWHYCIFINLKIEDEAYLLGVAEMGVCFQIAWKSLKFVVALPQVLDSQPIPHQQNESQ